MKKQMTLIFVKGTAAVAPGNVLAALSRTAPETNQPAEGTDEQKRTAELAKVGDLVGDRLIVRSLLENTSTGLVLSTVEFEVPFENFGLFTTDLDDAILSLPRSYYFDPTEKKPKPAPDLATSAPASAAFTNSDLTVTLLNDVTADTGVWVLISAVTGSGPRNQVRHDVIKKDAADKKHITLNAPGPLATGAYKILTLVTGYQATVLAASVT